MSKSGIKVFAPATVANVAVGFDILGFALNEPGDEVIIKEGISPGLIITEITGAHGKLSKDIMKNTAGFSAYRLLEHLGETNRPLEMTIHKKMPFGSGLGSSAASAVAGVFAVNEFLKTGLSKQELLPFAIEGEQIASKSIHADNVAPSLLGGMILVRDAVTADVKRIHLPHGLSVAVILPHVEVLTSESRKMLRTDVSLADHVKQSANLAAFISAMYTFDLDLIQRSLTDIIIEPQRAGSIPHFYDVKEMALTRGCLGFSISGSGPAMFALCDNSGAAEDIIDEAKRIYASAKIGVTTYYSTINQEGAIKL